MSNLNKAIEIACKAHEGQVDKAGKPYILHPIRLMMKCATEEEMIVAVLHDVVEDSSVSALDLKEAGFSSSILIAVECLSKREGEDYPDFISRLISNPLAKRVKIEDIRDNLDITRIDSLGEGDLMRIEKYHKALMQLQSEGK